MLGDLQNKAGGITVKGQSYKIKIISYDSKFNAEVGRAAAERLVHRDNVHSIIGEYASIVALGVAEVTEPAKVIFLTNCGSDRIFNPAFNYTLRCKAVGVTVMSYSYERIKSLPANAVKTAVVAGYDDEGGHYMVGLTSKGLELAGVKVTNLFFSRGTTDFGPLSTKILSLKPDYFQTGGVISTTDHLRAMTAVFQSGWRGKWGGDSQTVAILPDLVKIVGKEPLEGGLVGIEDPTVHLPNPTPDLMDWRKNYEARYKEWRHEGLAWMPNFYFLMQAIQAANSLSPDDIMAAFTPALDLYFPYGGHCKVIKRPDKNVQKYRDILYCFCQEKK